MEVPDIVLSTSSLLSPFPSLSSMPILGYRYLSSPPTTSINQQSGPSYYSMSLSALPTEFDVRVIEDLGRFDTTHLDHVSKHH
jgi:hypothetical protein